MGGFNTTVDDKDVQDVLARLKAATDDLTPANDDVGRLLQLRVQRQFELQAVPGGGKWTPLKPRTIEQRQKSGHWPGPLLRVQGDLYRSITYKASATEVVLGTNWPSAAAHQFGYKSIPARHYMLDAANAVPQDWLKAVVARYQLHLAMATGSN